MKKKALLQFVSLVLCVVFVSTISVFAETEVHLHSDACQHRHVEDIEEYLAQLNAGLIIPLNTTITTFDSANNDSTDPLLTLLLVHFGYGRIVQMF